MSLPLTFAAVTLADAWLAGRPEPWAHRARRATKPAIVPLAAWQLRGRRDGPLTGSTAAALAAGWVGDVALLAEGKRPFLAGLSSFAVGHVASLSGLVRHRSPGMAVLPAAALALGAGLGPVLALAAQRREPGLGAPVLAYAALLAATTATASHLDDDLPADARARLAVGGWLFLVSDGLLGARSFVLEQPAPWTERAVMVTYAAAQWSAAGGAARA